MDRLDKAHYVALAVQRISELVVGVERILMDSIATHALRTQLLRDARLVRRLRLQLVRAKQLAAPTDPKLPAEKTTWERMSDDDIIASYARKQR